MTAEEKQAQLQQLRQSLQMLKAQRAVLGAAIEPALAALQQQIAALEREQAATASSEERRIVTAFFSDIVGSTALAEKLDPEDWQQIVAEIQALGGRVIQKYEGTVLQYLGDGLLAIFGAPQPSERDPENAVRAALELQASLSALQIQPPIHMRVGIHTGLVILGLIGSEVKREYTAIGDAMNLAARLQTAAPPDCVLISHETYRCVRGVFDMTPQPLITVKGKSEPIQTYVVRLAKPRPFRTVTRGVTGIETQSIGREAERRRLRAAFETACTEHTCVWGQIIGEPGIGKSRLLSDSLEELDLLPEPFRLLRARAYQGDEKHAFALIRRMWFDRFQIAEDAPLPEAEAQWQQQFLELRGPGNEEAAHALGLLVGLPFQNSPYLGAARFDPAQVKGRAQVVSRELLTAMCADMPVVILLEDLHWADPSSWDYFGQVLLNDADADRSPQGVFVLATARPEWNPPPAVIRHHHYLQINLAALPDAACRALVAQLLKRVENVPADVVQLVVTRSEGVPYFAEEIVNWFLDRGVIDQSSEPWRFNPARLNEVPLPTTLQHLLLTRLSALQENERVALQRGSIFGRDFWEGGLETLGVANSAAALRQLQPRSFVEVQPESALIGEREWSFHHNLLREVAYESMLKRERKELHKAAARWLEEQARRAGRLDEFVGILAEHAERAGDVSAAADWYQRAGERARTQGALLEARAAFEHVLELAPIHDHARRWHAWLGRDEVVVRLGDREANRQSVEALLELAQYLGAAQLAEAHYHKALYLDALGDYWAALAEYDIAVAQVRQANNLELEARLLGMKIICMNRLGDAAGASATVDYVLARIHELPEAVAARVLTNVAIYYIESGDLSRAAQLHRQHAAIGQRLGDRAAQGNALVNLGYDYIRLGTYQDARQALEQSIKLFEAIGARRERAYAQLNLGLVHWRSGDFTAARHLFQHLQQELEVVDDAFARAAGLSYQAIVLEQTAEPAAARQYFSKARGIMANVGARGYAMDAVAGLARCALALHDREEAALHTAELWNYLRLQDAHGMEFPIWAYVTCAQAFAALDEPDKARQAIEEGYRELLRRADKIGEIRWGQSFLDNVPEHRMLVELWDRAIGATNTHSEVTP